MKRVRESKLPQIDLHSGGLIITREPQWVMTVLGSCVAVTMFSPRVRLAAICHAMLPHPRPDFEAGPNNPAEHFRFVSHALPVMTDRFFQMGIAPSEIEVKLFGGANILHAEPGETQKHWVGNANVATARDFLAQARFLVAAENVGGTRGCKIFFNTESGVVLHKHLSQRDATHPSP